MGSRFKLALVQMLVCNNRQKNLVHVEKLITQAARNGARVVAIPEYFTCYVDPKVLVANKESTEGVTCKMMSRVARENNIFLFGGTMPREIPDSDKLSNSCHIFNPEGNLVAHFSKIHLYNADLGPGLTIDESEFNKAGNEFITVDTDICKIGVGICVDLRYPEMANLYTRKGCKLLMFISGYNLKTGPAHLDVLQRARAIDNQVYVANIGPATNTEAPYVTYGHSAVVDPWGKVISKAGPGEEIIYADIDLDYVDEVRNSYPLHKIRRTDLYDTVELQEGTPV